MARIVLVLFLSAVVAGCGARSESVRDRPAEFDPAQGDVAQAGQETITSDQVDAVLDETATSFAALGRPFPAAGTPFYLDLRDEAVQYLLRISVDEQEAERLGVSVDEAAVDEAFDRVDPAFLEQQQNRLALTAERVRADIRDRQRLEALFAAVVAQKSQDETGLEAMRAWDEHVKSEIAAARFAPGWEPVPEPRSPVPPELEQLPDPSHECDLPSGTYSLWEAAAHGCVAKLGIPIPGKHGKLCPDIPIHDGLGYDIPDGPYGQYQMSLMDSAPSCAPYPETTVTIPDAGDGGDCSELCNYGEGFMLDPELPRRDDQSPSRQ